MKGFKTLIFHLLYGLPAVLLLVVDYAGAHVDWEELLDPEHIKYVIPGLAVIGIVLRFYTSTKIGENHDFDTNGVIK